MNILLEMKARLLAGTDLLPDQKFKTSKSKFKRLELMEKKNGSPTWKASIGKILEKSKEDR